MNKHIFILFVAVGVLVECAPQHRYWPLYVAYGNAFEDVPKITTGDAASVAPVVEPIVEENLPVTDIPTIAQIDDAFTLAPLIEEEMPVTEVSEVIITENVQEPQPIMEAEPTISDKAIEESIWERAARNLALRPDLLAWLSSLTPEMLAPKTAEDELTPVSQMEEKASPQTSPVIDEVPTEVQPLEIIENIPEIVVETMPETIKSEDIITEPEIVTEVINVESEIVTEEPQTESPVIAEELNIKPALIPTEVNSMVDDFKMKSKKPSFNKVKLDNFKEEQSAKKGKTLLSDAPESFLQGFRSPIFPSFSYSVRHVPSQSFWS